MSDLSDLAKVDYVGRVNRAIDHVLAHLSEPLKLEDVAAAASFSPYHFHRIFRGLVGETLNVFVNRVRLERALYLLSHREGVSLTEVALECGFSSSSSFSRSFRAHFGVAPSAFDLDSHRHAQRQELDIARLPAGDNPDNFSVALRQLPPRHLAYVRVLRPFEPGRVTAAAERLLAWAEKHGVADNQWIGTMWDDPDLVSLEKCRYDVAVEVPRAFAADSSDGEVCHAALGAMEVAELDIAGPIELEQRALDWLYYTWLPASGYAPDHHPAIEAWNGRPFAHGNAHFELRVQLAVVALDASRRGRG